MSRVYIIIAILLSCASSAFAQQIWDIVYFSDVTPIVQLSLGDMGYQLYELQTQIGEHQISGAMPLIEQDALVLMNTYKDLANYPLIQTMEQTWAKVEVLDTYISSLEHSLYQGNSIQLQIQSEISTISADISVCTTQKNENDKIYQSALQWSVPTQDLDAIVHVSQSNASCIADKQTLLHAKQELLQNLDAQMQPIADKYDYLVSHRDDILTHFNLLNANYLQNVINLQQDLKNQNF